MASGDEHVRTIISKSIPFVANTGIEVEGLERGYVKLRLPSCAQQEPRRHDLRRRTVHLGRAARRRLFVSSFDTSRFYPVVRDMSITYKRPAQTDVWVEVRISEDIPVARGLRRDPSHVSLTRTDQS